MIDCAILNGALNSLKNSSWVWTAGGRHGQERDQMSFTGVHTPSP